MLVNSDNHGVAKSKETGGNTGFMRPCPSQLIGHRRFLYLASQVRLGEQEKVTGVVLGKTNRRCQHSGDRVLESRKRSRLPGNRPNTTTSSTLTDDDR